MDPVVVHALDLLDAVLMNSRLHAGAIGLFCLGALLLYAGWLGYRSP